MQVGVQELPWVGALEGVNLLMLILAHLGLVLESSVVQGVGEVVPHCLQGQEAAGEAAHLQITDGVCL